MPKGATSLDFAFSIHSEIGIKTRGTRVNGKLVPLNHELKSGDQIEVITSIHQNQHLEKFQNKILLRVEFQSQ